MSETRKDGIYPAPGVPLRFMELGLYHPSDLVHWLTPFREGVTYEQEKGAFLNSSVYWGAMPFIPWLESFDDRPKTPEDIERIEAYKQKMIAAEKHHRERKAEDMLRRGTISEEIAARWKAKNRWERAVESGLPRPKDSKRWRRIK